MKKFLLLTFGIIIFGFGINNINAKVLEIDGFKTVGINQNNKLYVYDNNVDISDTGSWSSSDESIVTVDNTGTLTGKELGNAKIYFEYLTGGLTIRLGDVDANGAINSVDALYIRQYLDTDNPRNFSETQKMLADVNQDGIITDEDAELVINATVGLASLNTINVPNGMEGLNSYTNIYPATDEDFTYKVNYDVEVVSEVKSTTIEQLVDKLRENELFSEMNIVYENNKLTFSYEVEGQMHETILNVENNVLSFDTGTISNYAEAEKAFGDLIINVLLMQTLLESVGYNNDTVDIPDNPNFLINGMELIAGDEKEFTDGESTIKVTEMTYKIDLTHFYFPETESNDNDSFLEELGLDVLVNQDIKTTADIQKVIEENKVSNNIDNPETGAAIPVVAGIILISSAVGIRVYTKKKNLIKNI